MLTMARGNVQWFRGGLVSKAHRLYRDVLVVGLEVFEDLDDREGRAGEEALLRVGRGALHLS